MNTNPTNDRRHRAFVLLASLDSEAPEKVAANLDSLSDDFAELVLFVLPPPCAASVRPISSTPIQIQKPTRAGSGAPGAATPDEPKHRAAED